MYAKPVIVALCASLVIPMTVNARQVTDQLTVVAPEKAAISYQKWTDRTAGRLSRSIRQATNLYRDTSSIGYARVQFRLGQQGRPEMIDLAGPSSSGNINRISMRAIRNMGSLHPLPQGVRPGSKFEAWIIVANDAAQRDSMLGSLRIQHRAQTMALAPEERPVLIAMK